MPQTEPADPVTTESGCEPAEPMPPRRRANTRDTADACERQEVLQRLHEREGDQLVDATREQLYEFHIWHLCEQGLVRRHSNGGYALTPAGVAEVRMGELPNGSPTGSQQPAALAQPVVARLDVQDEEFSGGQTFERR